jgi:hypothetical protein
MDQQTRSDQSNEHFHFLSASLRFLLADGDYQALQRAEGTNNHQGD